MEYDERLQANAKGDAPNRLGIGQGAGENQRGGDCAVRQQQTVPKRPPAGFSGYHAGVAPGQAQCWRGLFLLELKVDVVVFERAALGLG